MCKFKNSVAYFSKLVIIFQMVLKGEIPWSRCMRTEIKDPRKFYIHTFPPKGRVYDLNALDSTAQEWCLAIQEVRQFFFESP